MVFFYSQMMGPKNFQAEQKNGKILLIGGPFFLALLITCHLLLLFLHFDRALKRTQVTKEPKQEEKPKKGT